MVMDWWMSIVWFSIMDWCGYFMDDWCHFVNEWFTMNNSIEAIVIISGIFYCAFMAYQQQQRKLWEIFPFYAHKRNYFATLTISINQWVWTVDNISLTCFMLRFWITSQMILDIISEAVLWVWVVVIVVVVGNFGIHWSCMCNCRKIEREREKNKQ